MHKPILDWVQYSSAARQAAAEGCVLLENHDNVLPLPLKDTCALFGRTQLNYYKSGMGSGGLVNAPYVHGILEAFETEAHIIPDTELIKIYRAWGEDHPFDRGKGWALEPWCQDEMPLSDELVKDAAARNNTAIVLIGRTAGEDRDNFAGKGSYLLTDAEEDMLEKVCRYFSRTVVLLNTGNIIDMGWVRRFNPSAVMYIWQGGMEGGNGVMDVLTGRQSPSGHLSDTIALSIDDYPSAKNFGDDKTVIYQEDIYVGYRYFETFAKDRTAYPFGYGLSYTDFSISADITAGIPSADSYLYINYTIRNTGSRRGKAVGQFYIEAPQGVLGKPSRQLIAFTKTEELEAGEYEAGILSVSYSQFASYDDSGITGHAFCYVLEAGVYNIYGGTDVRSAVKIGSFEVEESFAVSQLSQKMAPIQPFTRFRPHENPDGSLTCTLEDTPLRNSRALPDCCPNCLPFNGDKGLKLSDVASGNTDMAVFLSQIPDDILCQIVKGEGMCSPKVTPGTAAAFGGITPALEHFGIPAGCCSDGPSGLRMDCGTNAFSLPGGTLLACTFNTALNADLFEFEGLEMRNNHIESLLGPGINIHRNPLNGRNFEYFSEDPYLTGRMACAQLEGMARNNSTGTIKHFCANNQEFHRHDIDSVVSERALREIYLKGFEMAVKSGYAKSIMTTYGSVNGLWTAGSSEQNTDILRNEWDFSGIVMTDWWARINNDFNAEPSRDNLASMVKAQNDLFMVVADTEKTIGDLKDALTSGRIERRHLVRCAANICRFLLESPAFLRLSGIDTKPELINAPEEACFTAPFDLIYIDVDGRTEYSLSDIPSDKGDSYSFGINTNYSGIYKITITAKPEGSMLAQIPLTVFTDNSPFGIYSFNGNDRKEISLTREGNLWGNHHYIKLYFAQSGLNPVSIIFEPADKTE